MFNSNQVDAMLRRLQAGELVQSHEGLAIDRWDVSRRDYGETIASEPETYADMLAPAFILGEPEIASCLTGIGASRLRVPVKQVRRFREATVIGWRSIATRSGVFSSADNYLRGDFEDFFGTCHEGFAKSSGWLLCASNTGPRLVMRGVTLFLSGLEAGNYGSFLFRFLPKLLLFRALGLRADQIVVPDKSSFVVQILAWCGLTEARLISVRETTNVVFDELLMIDDFDAEGAQCESTRGRLMSRVGTSEPRTKLYVSRYLSTGYRPNYRPLDNELAIQRMLERMGVTVVYPELMSFEKQVAVFSQARIVVGPSGSGMLNSMFATPGCGVLDLESYTTTVRQHAKIYGTCGHRYAFGFGRFRDDRDIPGFLKRWTLPVSIVEEGVSGLLTAYP